jgi:glycosyltransferase involved in cell wall biosynthesis
MKKRVSDKKVIALIIHKLTSGGAQKMLSNLSGYLAVDYDVHVIVFDGSTQTYATTGTLHDLNLKPAKNSLGQMLTFIKRVLKVRKIKKNINADCSISFLDGPNLVNYLSRRKDKVVLSVRSYLSLTPMSKKRRFYTKFISNHSDCTVAISEMVRQDLKNNFGLKNSKLLTINNACDIDTIKKLSKLQNDYVWSRKPNTFYFVTVGRLTEAKGHWHLLRAFKELIKRNDNVHLMIVGTGELNERTTQLIIDLEIDEYVTMTGFQNNPHAIVDKCDAFVFTSIFEGFGNVILDALALSKPVISTDCFTGPRNILAPETSLNKQTTNIECAKYGILVPVGNKKHFNASDEISSDERYLVDAMEMVINKPELCEKYSSCSVKRAEDFSVKKTKEQWKNLIEKITC